MDYITINGKRYPGSDFRFPSKPKTNADKIRSMNDEELAAWLFIIKPWLWLEWLKQEVSE